MKKIINSPEAFVDEVIDGILLAHPEQLRAASADRRAMVRSSAGADGIVGIVTGGGSGHLPLFLGYVGEGLASGVAIGNVFSSPSPEQILDATVASDGGAGVLYLYGNYGGDVLNFDLAADLAGARGIRTATVLGADDVLSAPADSRTSRRGVAGIALVFKCAGAAAARGDDLAEVARIAAKAADAVLTMGVGLSPTILPAAGEPTFTLADGEMEIGIGIHGEPGRHRGPLETADEIADRFCDVIVAELAPASGDRVAVLVNGLGATPLEELYLLFRRVNARLDAIGVAVHRAYVGEYATSLEMAGASVSIMKLDDELAQLIDAPCDSPFIKQGWVAGSSDRGDAPGGSRGAVASETVDDGERSGERPVEVQGSGGVTLGGDGTWRAVALRVAQELPGHEAELRELDAAVGDGDLGLTVAAGCAAITRDVGALPADAHPGEVVRTAGAAFASGNPSTYAALVGAGLVAAGDHLLADDPESATVAAALEVLTRTIRQRGKAEPGDKTVVDVLLAVREGLDADPSDRAGAAVAAARRAVDEGTTLVNKRGRAAWLQERSAGHPDPGSVAMLRCVEAIAAAVERPASA